MNSRTWDIPSIGRETYLFCASLCILFLTVSEILDFFELPFESLVSRLLMSSSSVPVSFVTSAVAATGYMGIFVLMTLESVSLPVPSEVLLPFSGYLASKGSLSFQGVLVASTSAGMIGALIDYYLALKFGRSLVDRLLKWSGANAGALRRMESWISGRGSWSVLIARFIPGMRTAISLPAGVLRMRLRPFVSMTLVGTVGWSVLLVYLGYAAGKLWQSTSLQSMSFLTDLLLYLGFVSSLSYAIYYLIRRIRPHPSHRANI